MKKVLLLLLCLAIGIAANAKEITRQQALQKAQQFMKDKEFTTSEMALRRDGVLEPQGYYIFNAKDGGFVIVSGNDHMPEILGYSEQGKIDEETVPCGLKWLLGCYEQMAKNAESNTINLSKNRTRSDKVPVAPFVTTTWGQNTPYNAMCPKVDGARALTGCVATAMAQIMNYYCWPNEVTVPIPAYTTEKYKVSVPELEPTTFTWGHLNKTNLSKLMRYCGQAVMMDYGPTASGAGAPEEAFKKYFGYDEGCRFVSRDAYSDADWDDLIYEEMAAQRPVWYNGYDGVEGHAFVLCGYANDHFYINWGWDGGGDGYFILDGISPSVGAYNLDQGAVIGIKPKGEPNPVSFFQRRIVMENKGWSSNGQYVIGVETQKRLSEEYPDNFIGIDIQVAGRHEMTESENSEYIKGKLGGSPCCWINRLGYMGSYYSDIKNIIELQKNSAMADICATATYAKPDKSAITVTTESTFGFNSSDEDFRIAFVLLEDNVGPYTQNNDFYSNPQASDNPDDWLNFWVHSGTEVDMLFNNIVRGYYGDAQGIAGSIPATIEKDKAYRYEYTFSVHPPYNNLYQYNYDNFRVVALLIDKSTGEIMNAYQTKIVYDKNVENLTFEFRNGDKRLVDGETVLWKSKGIADDNLVMGTNLESGGLILNTFKKQSVSCTATLEILSNTMGSQTLIWGMGGNAVTLTGNSQTVSFMTDSNGKAEVQLTASNIQQFGELEAKLTATINGVSQSVVIKFIHHQSDAQIGDDIKLSDGQAWWNNATVNSYDGSPVGYMQGTHKEERYSAATFIPAHLFGDNIPTIDGIAFFGGTSGMANIEVWVSTHLPADGEKPDIAIISFPDDKLALEKWNNMVFNQHYQIPEQGVYVGYSFDIVDMSTFRSSTPIMFSDKTRDDALWFKTESMSEWIDRFDDLQGNLQLRILFGGGAIKKNAVRFAKVEPVYTLVGKPVNFLFLVYNEGTATVSSIDLQWGDKLYPVSLNLKPFTYNDGYSVAVVEVGSEAEYQERTFTIAKVNGMDNESDNKSATFPFYIVRQKSPSIVVLEEFTGTWCGYSTEANLVMAELQKEFSDSLITICVHGSSQYANDPMQIPEYSDVRKLSGGAYPSLVINREGNANDDAWTPFYDCDIDYYTKEAYTKIKPGYIKVGATWADESKNAINIQTRTTFELNASELPFEIGYVLQEDGMSGEGVEWAQSNIYSGIEDIYDRRLESLTKLPPLIYGQKYDNVPVAAWDVYKGVPGSLVGPFTAGVPVEGSFLADIKGNTLIQNKENLSVVALIVNKETGKIINAAKCKIGDSLPPSGINSIMKMGATFDIYNLQGRKVRTGATSLNGLPKGVYIIDGRKVIK